jgi:hypothetical protein
MAEAEGLGQVGGRREARRGDRRESGETLCRSWLIRPAEIPPPATLTRCRPPLKGEKTGGGAGCRIMASEGSGDDRLCPLGRCLQGCRIVASGMDHPTALHLQHESGEGHILAERRLGAVVEHLKLRQPRQQRDQIMPKAGAASNLAREPPPQSTARGSSRVRRANHRCSRQIASDSRPLPYRRTPVSICPPPCSLRHGYRRSPVRQFM